MEHYDELVKTLSMTMGAAWASGINLYATLLVLGIMGTTGNIVLPESLHILMDPMVLGAAGIMYFIEFIADKTPGVDTGWDTIHTFVRIPAGVMLAAGAVGDVDPGVAVAAALLGGGLAAGSHAAKAGSRVLINASPEPFSNWIASILEDVVVVGGIWTSLTHPGLFIVLLVMFVLILIWLMPKLWRGIKKLATVVGRWFGTESNSSSVPKVDSNDSQYK
ncbi:protein of unknown function [Desulfocicer vacuolatum DSM 3385]|uniref:DUF4126 domain-containing protein n=1 Tax=Desulfocicer vacuolatum DSM 3385 TaxID=1121400 RepID=A0A1W2CPZ3_9BACT|nr:DUF4126 domain-containing protein [Desulfocicer vacuolatum]SMC87327.1 protein of unknown function [Desulfocicer vacuolatum DSM 3385]